MGAAAALNARSAVALAAAAAVAIGAVPRILLAADALPAVLRPFVWSDPASVYLRGLAGHRLPYVDSPFEYPPLVGVLSAAFSLASDGPGAFVTLWALVAVAGAGLVAWMLAGAAGPPAVWRRFVLAPQLLLFGTINFDLLAVAFAVAALVAARRGRDLAVAAHLALGTASKLYPFAVAPLAVLRARRPVLVVGVLAGILALCYLPAVLAGRSGAQGPGYYLVGIGANLDSPWGLVARVLDTLGVPDPQAVVVFVTLGGLAATYLAAVLPRARSADPVTAFGLAIVTTMLWSRLYSPQYSLWVLPLFALLPLSGRLFGLLVAGDVIVFAAIYPLTLVPWRPGDAAAAALLALLVGGVVLRHAALIGTWLALRRR